MELDCLKLYHSYTSSFDTLSDTECGRLVKAMLKYSMTGETLELRGNERFIFPMMKERIDTDKKQAETEAAEHAEKCETNRRNATKSNRFSVKATAFEEKRPLLETAQEREREEEKESTKEKEEEKDKESMFYLSKITSLVINYLNNITGYKYRANNQKTRKLIQARLNEGYTVDDFETVISKMVKAWKGTKMEPYLRPETLFSNKFESYLNRSEVESKDALDMVLGGVFVDIGGAANE